MIDQALGELTLDNLNLACTGQLREVRHRNLSAVKDKAAKLLEQNGCKIVAIPSLSLIIPLLNHAADESREELQAVWAALLANIMIDGGTTMRRLFIEIVGKMEPADLIVLRVINNFMATRGHNMDFLRADAAKLGVELYQFEVALAALIEMKCAIISNASQVAATGLGKALLSACDVKQQK